MSVVMFSATSPAFAHCHDEGGGGSGGSVSGVPEINGSAAATGLALVVGTALLLLDRSKQTQVEHA